MLFKNPKNFLFYLIDDWGGIGGVRGSITGGVSSIWGGISVSGGVGVWGGIGRVGASYWSYVTGTVRYWGASGDEARLSFGSGEGDSQNGE